METMFQQREKDAQTILHGFVNLLFQTYLDIISEKKVYCSLRSCFKISRAFIQE